ncbi:MAG: CYTH domain-containing protein [Pleurocapsa sp. SU_5_0]|nr:CYTH domain-containing protein [Pleurocapsa sp. SU_5_0]NJO97514.1 CYTH domain-containing protein [Pleurocapsa sp. CRU_1_2]NJR47407.1 CYTH domain-containing protein [Hyellaceae cyanobacterium CSU_1_1]
MNTEIERKYLVKKAVWRSHKKLLESQFPDIGVKYCQGYIPTSNSTTVRLRTVDKQAYLTIKSKAIGYTRAEFEYLIPVDDAQEMLNNLCLKPLIEKFRYKIKIDNLTWEVDEFLGENAGLIIAEVELENENQKINLPPWIDREVKDKKYFNSYLVKHPYSKWEEK